ncbi:hypothetical protein, partial [Prosthecobacter sp.]|uniref:hypothetical protein n=1 Tax=Prosthecobacter sp. TaxID=1965333 RepID=UPI0037CA6A66
YLSEKLRPNRSVAYGSSIENDKTGLTWKWSVGIWPSRLDKGQAAKARGYTLITPFCPIDESTPMGPDLPVAFRILGPDGKILAETRFLVNVQPELIPKQRMEYQTLDAQESPAGWYLDGQPGGAAQLRLGDAALMYPLSLTWLQKYKNVGLPTDKPITTVVLLPEALKPPKRSNIRRLEWGEKAGLPWAWWTSWLIGPQTEFRVGAGMIEIDEELLDGFEAGYYHFRVLNLLAADVPVFLEGKLQKPALFDKYYTVFIPKPEPVYPRPSSPVLEIVAPAPTGWPSVRAVAFKKSTIHPTASYAVAMPLRFKNIGERAIDISTLSALLYLPDGTVIDDKLLVGPSGALPMLKKVEKNCYPFADTSFTLVTGPWVGIGSGQLPPGEETTLNTGFYLGMPDSLPDAAKSIDSKIIGVKILQMATNGSGEDILLYTGVINLNLEWHENWSESEHNALLKR